ncbi:precorrin-6A reductase [Pseudoflavonifractor sp. 524-17]|nr:precorrin-6A reductase [Pseudoflavonifractor sp. 524-17]NCE63437.1 precorrin-6A reductase [Pseudoflavonifractor sp. 524-17]
MKIVVFSGTTEGRALSRRLVDGGAEVTVCVATEYGREEQGERENITVLTGRKTWREMAQVLAGAKLCVDATHPYAVRATEEIRRACAAAGVPLRRLLRREGGGAGTPVDSPAQAAAYLAEREGGILLTTGSKELSAFAALGPERLFPRVLPSHESLSACEAAGIPHRNIIAMQGPFSQEMNEALIRQFRISFVVSKDGGRVGGFWEKAAAAERTGAELVVIRRPRDFGEDFETVAAFCEEMMGCR